MLEFIEEALDEVSFAVEREIAGPRHLTICFWRNHRGDTSLGESVAADPRKKSHRGVLELPTFRKTLAASTGANHTSRGRTLSKRSRIHDRGSILVHWPCCVGVDRDRLCVNARCQSQRPVRCTTAIQHLSRLSAPDAIHSRTSYSNATPSGSLSSNHSSAARAVANTLTWSISPTAFLVST